MNRLLALLSVALLLPACAEVTRTKLEFPPVINVGGKDFISLDTLENHEFKVSRPENGEFTVELPQFHLPFYWTCGGVYSSGLVSGTEILDSADTVFDFKGVREVWVPIEGKPRKLYVFELR